MTNPPPRKNSNACDRLCLGTPETDRGQRNSRSRDRFPLRGRRLAVLLMLLMIPVIGGGAGTDSPWERNRLRIERMSAAERMRLERNFQKFLEMPEAERNKFRQLHQAIQEDARTGGRLQQVMEGYNKWLATLDPYQRQEILSEKDPITRAQIVQRLYRERSRPSPSPPEQRPNPLERLVRAIGIGMRIDSAFHLAPEDFNDVILVFERELDRNASEQAALQALPPHQRHLKILKQTFEALPPETLHDPQTPWPNEELMNRLLSAIGNKTVSDGIKRIPIPNRRRSILRLLLARELLNEWRPEIDKLQPTKEDIWELLEKVEPQRQAELAQLPPEELKQAIGMDALAQEHPELRDLLFVMQQLTPRPDRQGMRLPGMRGPDDRPGPGPRGPRRPGMPEGRRGDFLGGRHPEGPPPERPPRDGGPAPNGEPRPNGPPPQENRPGAF